MACWKKELLDSFYQSTKKEMKLVEEETENKLREKLDASIKVDEDDMKHSMTNHIVPYLVCCTMRKYLEKNDFIEMERNA